MHTVLWLIWLAAAVTAATLAPNPLYLALIFLAAGLVFAAWRSDSPLARSYRLFIAVGAYVFVGYVFFSVITVGGMRGTTVLITLPSLKLPAWLGGLVLGGPITAEALAWGATRGFQLWTLLTVFGTFNALVDHYRLLRLTPRSLFHAGLAVTIAVAFVPSIIRTSAEIVEAQRARGHRFRGLRSWLPLVAPLLAGSLEQSMQLAEAMDARGYGRTLSELRVTSDELRVASDELRVTSDELRAPGAGAQHRHRPGSRFSVLAPQLLVLGGLLLAGGGVFGWLYYGAGMLRLVFGGMLAGGGLLLWLALRELGQQVRRSVYRRERWRPRDTAAAAAGGLAVLALTVLRAGGVPLAYYPFPTIMAPDFNLWAGLALLLLAAPAAFAEQKNRRGGDEATRRRGPPDS